MSRTKSAPGSPTAAAPRLFLRLHCDAGGESGVATFYPAQQGKVNGVKGPGLAIIAASSRLAPPFHAAVVKALTGQLGDRHVRTDAQTYVGSHQGGALTGSIYAQTPCAAGRDVRHHQSQR